MNGDSGRIVYHMTKDENGQDIWKPMGMFIARLKLPFPSGFVMYEAVVLSKALKEDLESEYKHQLYDIHLFNPKGNCHDCTPREIPSENCSSEDGEMLR